MSLVAKASVTVGVLGFLAYCVYFDRKRRSAPDYKAKVLAKRNANKKSSKKGSELFDIPIFKDPSEMQAYFLTQVQLSDDLMQVGNFEEAVIHLANAAVVCSQKSEFLGVMQKSLPPQAFQILLKYYQVANENYIQKVLKDQSLNMAKPSSATSTTSSKQFIDDTDIE
ncbi:PREDICTED: mitochondrial import receptor subunit TOM20 homolog [Rhagoletis zephyria]|uniref:mitochondrial import receptor subunit TOM20 homolog n=1 Tax=Rhagoletis zephyria TaxID=28612 RepID=UPI000811618E|nr:PREDICTED: mitochondrial import receptor subunit TOM20 homolog [Rhagoletis zephyria]KAH9406075.1 Mitochondrial import receptor subunit TOM20 [Tyrophagus putrescentiae]